jgi:hypothetical protein
MKHFRIVLAAFIVMSAGALIQAQPAPLPPQQQAPPPQQQHDWLPHGVEALRQNATSKTEFTLDHSMLVFASKLDPDNDDLRRVIAGVSGVSVHRYHFAQPGMYESEAVNSIKDEYHAAGWKQVMNNHEKDGGPGVTDLWVRLENNAVSNVAILIARSSEVDFVLVSGSISPLDLSHLGGHFGIPKIEGGVEVPNKEVPNNTHRP